MSTKFVNITQENVATSGNVNIRRRPLEADEFNRYEGTFASGQSVSAGGGWVNSELRHGSFGHHDL